MESRCPKLGAGPLSNLGIASACGSPPISSGEVLYLAGDPTEVATPKFDRRDYILYRHGNDTGGSVGGVFVLEIRP